MSLRDLRVVHRANYTVALWCVDVGLVSLYTLSSDVSSPPRFYGASLSPSLLCNFPTVTKEIQELAHKGTKDPE